MGYRSQIAMMIEGKSVPALLASFRMEDQNSAEWAECMEMMTVTEDGIYLAAGGWKWYESYPDVQWFERLWDMASEMGEETTGEGEHMKFVHDLSGRFIRVGEDDNDVENRDFGPNVDWEGLQLVRSIEFNREVEWK